MRTTIGILLLFFSTTFLLHSQDRVKKQIRIQKATAPIKLDGLLDETSWQQADIGKDYQQQFPSDSIKAIAQTELRFTYDDKFLYIGAKMLNPGPRTYVTPSLRRDFRGGGNDMFVIAV